jgi:hypothetical protein
MIQRNPICIRMADGQLCEDGDTVQEISTCTKWTFRGAETELHLRGNIKSEIKIALASRASYKSTDTIWASDDVLEYDAPVEPSITVGVDEFVHGYTLLGKWNIEDHRCISDEESAIVDELLTNVLKVRGSMSSEEWKSIYSREAINNAKF